jgi:hypothetical protein
MTRKFITFFAVFAIICLSIIIVTNMFSFKNVEGLSPNNKKVKKSDALFNKKGKSTKDSRKKHIKNTKQNKLLKKN